MDKQTDNSQAPADLARLVTEVLAKAPFPLNAKDIRCQLIAWGVTVPTKAVNAVLYKGAYSSVKAMPGRPPAWYVKDSASAPQIGRAPTGPFAEVRMQGLGSFWPAPGLSDATLKAFLEQCALLSPEKTLHYPPTAEGRRIAGLASGFKTIEQAAETGDLPRAADKKVGRADGEAAVPRNQGDH